jgi:glycosyltransferase involved in cell wall biosynthesis
MRFSVLLPTRNRLDLLRYALESVFRQDFDDWEIIVSDNASDQDVCGYVEGIGDPRVKYLRTDRFLPVTENWNRALEKSSGDYVVMLGDDDALEKGYFETLSHLVEEYDHPDIIYHKALLYAYPGVLPEFPEGSLKESACAPFFAGATEPFFLDHREAVKLVRKSMDFRVRFDYNMQYSLVKKSFIDSLREKGDFFQSPYPDYYATNVMFLKGRRILVYPWALVTIGISPKSFGYYYFNKKEAEGTEFLKNLPDRQPAEKLRSVILPGTDMNSSWLLAMETVRANYGEEFHLRVNYNRYRFLQIQSNYEFRYRTGQLTQQEFASAKKRWTLPEKLFLSPFLFTAMMFMKFFPSYKDHKIIRAMIECISPYVYSDTGTCAGSYNNILEVFHRRERNPSPVRNAG